MFDGDRRVQIALNELTLASGVFIVINDPDRKAPIVSIHNETHIKISITRSLQVQSTYLKKLHRMVVKVKVKVY